ncbi:MAG TPA: phosphotransferase [Candidatus Dormibacteraeota bacterium]|nr:phosphotransferase [Candidatus Dormibacteraeota bacterium]
MGHTISVRNGPAVQAAQEIARRHGIAAEQARVLHDATNVVVHLAPSPVVAKIGRASVGDHGWRKLTTELEIARHLIRAGAPVVGPSQELPPGPHAQGDFAMTFWRHQNHDPDAIATSRGAGHALAQVYEGLDTYPETFPSFLERQVRRTAKILFGESAPSPLSICDRDFLRSQYLSITSELHGRKLRFRTLHGDPHRGNVLVSKVGYLLIDFESVCSGPLEWDLSALPGLGAGAFNVDEDLLSLLRRLRSLCVAVWCWARARSSTSLDRTARYHMGVLRLAAET